MLLVGPSLCLRSSKTEKWRFSENSEKVKMSNFSTIFENRISMSHVLTYGRYQLFDITNFFKYYLRHFLAEISVEISAYAPTTAQFSFVVPIFSHVDKINNFWQQKQQVLFLSNMTPKVLPK